MYIKFNGERSYPNSASGFLSSGSYTDTDNNTLISHLFKSTATGYSGTSSEARNLFPHSILKHTLFVRTKGSNTIIDSLVHIIDLTRGSMAFYPFREDFIGGNGSEDTYDIIVKFEAQTPTNYGETSNNFTSEHSPNNNYSTQDYFHAENINKNFKEGYPVGYNSNFIPITYPLSGIYTTPYETFIKLPQFSLTGILLLNASGTTRAGYLNVNGPFRKHNQTHQHTYKIDHPYDINLINPDELIVYNPSEVEIDINDVNTPLIFPSGYTFKTVLGNYPDKIDYTNADPNGYFANNPFNAPVPNDMNTGNYSSKYIVRTGSKLIIEDCVTIIDAVIEVQDGGKLEWNSQSQFGNWTINYLGSPANYDVDIIDRVPPGSGCILHCLNTTMTVGDWNNYTITTNYTVPANTTIRVFGKLTIAPNIILTLDEGVRLEFAPSSKLVVEEGARFLTKGVPGNEVELTTICENMWDGIELRGKSSNINSFVSLEHTLLKNAITGIQSFSSLNKNDYFGLVSIVNSTIQDCITGININMPPINSFPTSLTNLFVNSAFITTNAIPDIRFTSGIDKKPKITHIKLYGAGSKSSFISCSFGNQNTWLLPHERGTGIDVVDSWLQLGFPLTPDINTFDNLTIGIILNDKTKFSVTEIDDAVFTDNIFGIIMLDRAYAHIHHNTFTVPQSTEALGGPVPGGVLKNKILPPSFTPFSLTDLEEGNLYSYSRPTGVFIKNSSGFVLNNNTFTGTPTQYPGPNCEYCNQGVIVDGTARSWKHMGNGLIISNNFNNISAGLIGQGNNNGDPGINDAYISGSGVSAVCNQFNNLVTLDFGLAKLGTSPQLLKPIRTQGYCYPVQDEDDKYHPTLNTYSGCYPTETRNIMNKSDDFDYYHANDNLPECHSAIKMKPCEYFNVAGDDVVGKCNDYYSIFDPISIPLTAKRTQYLDKENELTQRKLNFNSLLDGGNTSNLVTTVETGDLTFVITQLTQYGSYLSDIVLLAAINRLENDSQEDLFHILQANSKLSTEVWDAIVALSNPELEQDLILYQEGVSARESYINWIDHTTYERNTIFDGLFIADMIDNNSLSVSLDVLRNNSDPHIQQKLLPLLISEQQYAEAQTLLNIINQTSSGSLFTLEQEALLIMNRDNIEFQDLPDFIKDGLGQYWLDSPHQSSRSALLAGAHNKSYYIYPALIEIETESNKWDGSSEITTNETIDEITTLKCYPNPTNHTGFIKGYISDAEFINNQIIIYNSIGQVIKARQITSQNFEQSVVLPASGLYLVILMRNGEKIKQHKWIIQ